MSRAAWRIGSPSVCSHVIAFRMHAVQSRLRAVRESLAPVLRESRFKEHGRITPEEFVAAGDFLVYKYPAWQWSAGEAHRARAYLPADKQFLVNKGVPCFRRISALHPKKRRARLFSSPSSVKRIADAPDGEEVQLDDDDDERESWVVTDVPERIHPPPSEVRRASLTDAPAASIAHQLASSSRSGPRPSRPSSVPPDFHRRHSGTPKDTPPDDDGAEELSGFADGLDEREDPAQFTPGGTDAGLAKPSDAPADAVTAVRTYDCMITYDKYYQTPRMWLIGYDEDGLPLQPPQIFEDVASDHALKTVTIEPFPHGSPGAGHMDRLLEGRAAPQPGRSPYAMPMHVASIHPCKHASMMHKMIQRMNESGQYREQLSPPSPSWAAARGAAADEGVRVDQYLVIFLKFMASIVPTIELDATHSA